MSGKPDGATRTAPNNYHYTKVDGKWRLTHHIIAEAGLGRPLSQGERVYFVDGDRTNLDPANIEVREKTKTKEKRIHELEQRIRLLQEELDELRRN